MKHNRTLIICMAALVLASFGMGLATAQKGQEQDKRQVLMADYQITRDIDPQPGQSFPKNWGRLVNYVLDSNTSRKLLVFEAEDGTIRVARMSLDWNNHVIDEADVITIGRK